MALNDPQTLSVGADTITLPRIITATKSDPSLYQSADGKWTLKAGTTVSGRRRTLFRVDTNKWVDSEAVSGQLVNPSMSCYMVVDRPYNLAYYTNDQAADIALGLMNNLIASTATNLHKLLGGQS